MRYLSRSAGHSVEHLRCAPRTSSVAARGGAGVAATTKWDGRDWDGGRSSFRPNVLHGSLWIEGEDSFDGRLKKKDFLDGLFQLSREQDIYPSYCDSRTHFETR